MAKDKLKHSKAAHAKRSPVKWQLPMLFLVVLTVAGATLGLSWDSVAQYFQENNLGAIVRMQKFYFSSDYLTANREEYTIAPGVDGTADVAFWLYNYEGLNVSELEIRYTVEVEPAATVRYYVRTVEAEPEATVTWKDSNEDSHSITVDEEKEMIVLTGLEAGKTYTVTVTGENGYRKTLSAVIKVENSARGFFQNTKIYSDYVLLTVWTKGDSGEVSFTVPTGLIPDATDPYLKGCAAGDTISVELGEYASRTFRFFTTSSYDGGTIVISAGEKTVTVTDLN